MFIFFLFSYSNQLSLEGKVMLPLEGIIEGSHLDGRLAALMTRLAG